jgi:hypothetical protein
MLRQEFCYEGLILDSGFQGIVKLFQQRQMTCVEKPLVPTKLLPGMPL